MVAADLEESAGGEQDFPAGFVGLRVQLTVDPEGGAPTAPIVPGDDMVPFADLVHRGALQMGHLSGRPGCQAEVEVVLVTAEHEASLVISIILEGSDDSGPFLSRAHEDPALERQIARWKRGQLPGIVGDDDGVVLAIDGQGAESCGRGGVLSGSLDSSLAGASHWFHPVAFDPARMENPAGLVRLGAWHGAGRQESEAEDESCAGCLDHLRASSLPPPGAW